MNDKIKKICQLFLTFLKIGTFTFGGGYAMIPLIQKETVDKRGWITDSDILEIIAIAESTPGPIAINAATFVGFRVGGFFGALLATLGVILPSFLIVFCISFVLKEFQSVKLVQQAFYGIRIAVLALIINIVFGFTKGYVRLFVLVSYGLLGLVIFRALSRNIYKLLEDFLLTFQES